MCMWSTAGPPSVFVEWLNLSKEHEIIQVNRDAGVTVLSQFNHISFIRAKSRNQQGRAQTVCDPPISKILRDYPDAAKPEVFSNSLVDASLLHSSHVSIPMLPFLFPSRIRKRSAWSPELIPPPVTLVPAPPSCPWPRFSQDPSCFRNTAPSSRPLSFRTQPRMTYVSWKYRPRYPGTQRVDQTVTHRANSPPPFKG